MSYSWLLLGRGIIRCGKSDIFFYFGTPVLERRTVIGESFLWKPADNVTFFRATCFDPFREILRRYQNKTMPIRGRGGDLADDISTPHC